MGNSSRWRITIEGTVQGVGFRPFVYRTAVDLGLTGHVFNNSEGVTIEAEGDEELLQRLVDTIRNSPPPLARVHGLQCETINSEQGCHREPDEVGRGDPMKTMESTGLLRPFGLAMTNKNLQNPAFKILTSQDNTAVSTLISPDIAPCEDCMKEMSDASDRRTAYPFINCTNCGPRYSIIQSLPYDRPKTTMKVFELCDSCRDEYENPLDRRFHAQPNACQACGPRLTYRLSIANSGCQIPDARYQKGDIALRHQASGIRDPQERTSSPIDKALTAIGSGQIIAIKGVGGFHLACDAMNDDAVGKLRKRKHRDERPFAIMVRDIDTARELCHISRKEEQLLTSPQRPIVLLRKRNDAQISNLVAPHNKNLGVMLPSTPLHFLLFEGTRERGNEETILVMTSGNITDEPIAFKDEEAFTKLSKIADAFLTHDRDIHIRIDDSVARMMDGRPLIIRRARGYTPAPVRLTFEMPQILATGADLKNSICVTKGHNAFLSQHLGNMENLDANRALEQTAEHLMHILDIEPEVVACDMHPDYFSSRFAKDCSSRFAVHGSRFTAVQHHHAHIASCMAENDLPNEKVIGIALDGTGYGPDGTIWGGEILIADYEGFERAASFAPVPMPGGDKAAKEPWRMALAYLRSPVARGPWPASFKDIPSRRVELVREMIGKNINCPLTSSCGRLFDAVAALIGLRTVNTFEGQAAMELEQIANESETGSYQFSIESNDARERGDEGARELLQIDFSPTISAILTDLESNTDRGTISMRFHNTIIETLVQTCLKVRGPRSTVHGPRICLSGGCFQNAILTTKLKKNLVDEGFTVYTHSLVPPNDGGIALGQAAVTTHKYCKSEARNSKFETISKFE